MFDRTRSLPAIRLVAGAAVVALAVAACGGSSSTPSPAGSAAAPTQAAPADTPAPTAPPEEPSESAEAGGGGGGTTAGGCADMTAVAAALKNVDHYVANAKIGVALPEASGLDMSMDMVMKFQKPDKFEVTTGLGGGVLFAMRQVGEESWLQMFGAETWTKADASTSTTGTDPNLLGNLESEGLKPLTQIPAELDLPGSSSCVVGYSIEMPAGATGDASNPLSSLSSATAIALRVDTSTNLPESMGFIVDTTAAGASAPTSMVFTFDYQTPVDIQAPDPSTVTEGGLGGFPFPSGMELPSGLDLP
jgi:hypothetical protein